MGQATTYERDPATNLLLSTTDPLGRQTAYSYDGAGNVTSVTRLAGTSEAVATNFTYDPTFNQMTSVTDPLGHSTTLAYDVQGRLTRITNALGQASTAAYILFQELRRRAGKTVCADAQVTTLRERLVKLAVWVERSARRIVLHLPLTFPWLRTWRQLARAIGATS